MSQSSKRSQKRVAKNRSVFLVGLLVLAAVVLFLALSGDSTSVIEEVTSDSDDTQFVASLFDCEGKNKFNSECWKKIQIINKAVVHNLDAGQDFSWRFAFMNREEDTSTFSYSITTLKAADLVRTGCPLPADAEGFITAGSESEGITLEPNAFEQFSFDLTIPQGEYSDASCPYRYVLEVKRNGLLYGRATLDIAIRE